VQFLSNIHSQLVRTFWTLKDCDIHKTDYHLSVIRHTNELTDRSDKTLPLSFDEDKKKLRTKNILLDIQQFLWYQTGKIVKKLVILLIEIFILTASKHSKH